MAPIQVHPAKDEDNVTDLEGEAEGAKGDEEDGDEVVKDDDEGKEVDGTQSSKKKESTLLSKCSFLDVVEALVALVFCLLSIACVLVAVIYINYCTTDGVNFLCAWLIVHGISMLSAMTSIVFWRDHKRTSPSATFAATGSYLLALILIFFSTFWLVIGVTWQSCIGYSTLMLYFIMSVISLVIGAIYENRCPNTKLPLWLLIQAVCTIITTTIKVCCRISCQAMTNSTRNFLISFFPMTVFLIFQVAWLAVGNDWAFHAWRHEKLILTGSSNSTESTEFAICDQRLYIFFCCIIALFDIPVMVFILLSIAMTIVLIFYFASPCFQDNLSGNVNEGKDLEDQTIDDREEGKEHKTPTDVNVNINY